MKNESPSTFAFFQVWLKLDQWFCRTKFLCCKFIYFFINYLPFGKGVTLIVHQRMLFARFGWNWPSGSGQEENVKVYILAERQMTINKWSERLTWAFSSGKLKMTFLTHFALSLVLVPMVLEKNTKMGKDSNKTNDDSQYKNIYQKCSLKHLT